MNTFALKMIGIIAMLIDHIGAVFIPGDLPIYWVFRGIGRLAFPIFAFLIVEGFFHTKDFKKYLSRLGVFALVSEIPFDMAFHGTPLEFTSQNIFFTLFLGLVLINCMNIIMQKYSKKNFQSAFFNGLITLGFCILAIWLRTDYHYAGILLIAGFYLFRGNKIMTGISIFTVTGYLLGWFSGLATLSMIFIGFYNGKKGRDAKYLFYIFYPGHLLLLYLFNHLF